MPVFYVKMACSYEDSYFITDISTKNITSVPFSLGNIPLKSVVLFF